MVAAELRPTPSLRNIKRACIEAIRERYDLRDVSIFFSTLSMETTSHHYSFSGICFK